MRPPARPLGHPLAAGRRLGTGLLLSALALSACNRTPDAAPAAAAAPAQAADAALACGGTARVLTTGGVGIFRMSNYPNVYFYTSGMNIDVDGSPYAYHPSNDAIALDYIANYGESRANVQGQNGVPVVRGARGFIVSQTSLGNPAYAESDSRHWVDAESIPYVVIPGTLYAQPGNGIRPGNLAYAYNKRTSRGCFALCADVGPTGKAGEASVNLAKQLGVANTNAKNGGQDGDITYLILANSGTSRARSPVEIYNEGVAWQTRQGGADVLSCLGIRPASFPLLGLAETDLTQEIRAQTSAAFTITANPTVRRVKIVVDGQYPIYDAPLSLTATGTVPFAYTFSQAGYRDLVIEGYDDKGTLLTAVSRRLRVL